MAVGGAQRGRGWAITVSSMSYARGKRRANCALARPYFNNQRDWKLGVGAVGFLSGFLDPVFVVYPRNR